VISDFIVIQFSEFDSIWAFPLASGSGFTLILHEALGAKGWYPFQSLMRLPSFCLQKRGWSSEAKTGWVKYASGISANAWRTVDSPRMRCAVRPSLRQAGKRVKILMLLHVYNACRVFHSETKRCASLCFSLKFHGKNRIKTRNFPSKNIKNKRF